MTAKVHNVWAGIDPGLDGCAVLIDEDGYLVDFCDFPRMKIGTKNRIAGPLIANYIYDHWIERDGMALMNIKAAYIEQVGVFPGQGISSAFSFGHATGAITGIFWALGIRVEQVSPAVWKKATALQGKEKDSARGLAIQKFPNKADWFKRKKDINRSDAALIAWYGMNKEKGDG